MRGLGGAVYNLIAETIKEHMPGVANGKPPGGY
jgi:hypothetical protein